ncbi:MAG: 2-oxoglutarate and iron-dependent oxygenase domain-containing protein, partial [Cyanobacteria bacterium J06600_6]
MSEILFDEIPAIDLKDFTAKDPLVKQNLVQTVGDGFKNVGFIAVKNHGLSATMSNNLYRSIIDFFALPEATKLNYEIAGIGGQRGYTARGKEHAKGRSVGDLKEFYHIGQEIADADLERLNYPANVFPQEVPGFLATTVSAYRVLEETGIQILRAIALYLELPEDYFDNQVKFGNSILRPIHYFAIDNPEDIPPNAVRAAAHGDINLITLLMGASAEGLQILRQDDKW